MSKQAVGGQALIEGVMMQSKQKRAIAVRNTDGKIVVKKNKINNPTESIIAINIDIPITTLSALSLNIFLKNKSTLSCSSSSSIKNSDE